MWFNYLLFLQHSNHSWLLPLRLLLRVRHNEKLWAKVCVPPNIDKKYCFLQTMTQSSASSCTFKWFRRISHNCVPSSFQVRRKHHQRRQQRRHRREVISIILFCLILPIYDVNECAFWPDILTWSLQKQTHCQVCSPCLGHPTILQQTCHSSIARRTRYW